MNIQKQGFTLVELIVVITILAILGTIAIMAFSGYSKNARDSARISDIGNMKKSLELWILQSGMYPDPSSGTGVTYSGATVWLQGAFGDSVTSTVGKLDKKPVDPLYSNEYTYSVTNSKKEYQIGAVLEKDMVYNNPILQQTYAAGAGEAYISGTYNGILTTVGTNPIYMIALPSILISDTTITELKNIATNVLVYEGKTNLPSSYKVTGLTMTGTEFSFTPTVVWSGSSLTELNTQTGFQDMVSKLQTVYKSEPLFASLPEYTSIVTSDITPSVTTMSFVKGLVETNTNTTLENVATTYVSLAVVNGVCGTANETTVGTAPTENLCTIGAVSPTSGTGPWTWTCNGSNGGTNANCSAEKALYDWISCNGTNISVGTTETGAIIYANEILVGSNTEKQCWLNKDMAVGTMIVNGATNANESDGIVDKWCPGDHTTSATNMTCVNGALYTYKEAFRILDGNYYILENYGPLSKGGNLTDAKVQGICPNGYHVPSSSEIIYLYTNGQKGILDFYNSGWRHGVNNAFYGKQIGQNGGYYLSSDNTGGVGTVYYYTNDYIGGHYISQEGHQVRCLKN